MGEGVYEVTPGSDSGVSVERVTEEEAAAEEDERNKRRGKKEEKEEESVTNGGNTAVAEDREGTRGEGKDDEEDYDPFELD